MNFTYFKTFRQKFFASFVILLLAFLALMFPFVAKSVEHIVFRSMNNSADNLIEKLAQAINDQELIKIIKHEKQFVFYRIGLLDDQQRLLYDSHARRLFGPFSFPLQFTSHPEIQEALKSGTGYTEEYSHVLNQKMIYLARCFDFHGKRYLLRLAVPYEQTYELRREFEIGFILFSSLVLILFSALAFLVLHRITRPIRQIIGAIVPYQRGDTPDIAKIELKRSHHDEFQQLAYTLNSLSDRIREQIESIRQEKNEKELMQQQVLEMRKEFIANASHELKTPITIIRGFAETLEDNPNLPHDMRTSICEKIVSNCERMAKTIRNLLTLANIENLPQSRLQPCCMSRLASDSAQVIKTLYPHVKISLDLQEDIEILADVELLEVAVLNLLDNAAKYAKENPELQISIKRTTGQVQIAVSDNGIGISEADLSHVFERFYRAHKPHSKKLAGSGLGLSIVETIVKKHFGKVEAQSTQGVGSTFTLYIADDIQEILSKLHLSQLQSEKEHTHA
jgi:signal transduction histidine kinase